MLKNKVSTYLTLQARHTISLIFGLLITFGLLQQNLAYADVADGTSKKNYNIQSSSLGNGLSKFAGQNGINLSFDPKLTEGKQTNGLKGEYGVNEGFRELLKGSGLQIVVDESGGYFLEKAASAANQKKSVVDIELKSVAVRAKRYKEIGPMPGLNLTKEQIPGNVQSITAEDIKELHSLSISDLLNTKLQSVNVNDYQGNPFQMDVTYRGFTASPQLGTPQGLSVFFDGIRVNEPFGDVVNWDLIPMNAISSLDVFPGSNPLFGLNTLGGALSIKSKSGFKDAGVSAEVLAGSYGRKQLQVSGGWNNGSFAAFGAGNFFLEDGWRSNSPSKVNQAFGKLEWQGERASLSLAGLGVKTKLVGNGTVPLELYNEDPTAVYTSPDETNNKLLQFQLSGAFDVSDTFNITAMAYNRASTRHSSAGDIIDEENFRSQRSPTKKLGNGVELCGLTDENADGFPDYYLNALDPITFKSAFTDALALNNLTANYALLGALNPALPAGLTVEDIFNNAAIDRDPYLQGGQDAILDSFAGFSPVYTFDNAGIPTQIYIKPPANAKECLQTFPDGSTFTNVLKDNGRRGVYIIDANGNRLPGRDGARFGPYSGDKSGYVDGTPTGIITKSAIEQSTSGGALQLNWNLDTHKFMVGTSIDRAKASYIGTQRLGVIDDNRNVTNDASKLGDEYYAATHDITINDFDGKLQTTSAYFSETWTPTETLNLAVSGRYNVTNVKNSLAPNRVGRELTEIQNSPAFYIVCPGGDLTKCPHSLTEYTSFVDAYNKTFSGTTGTLDNYYELDKKRTEKFIYHSFNPSIGGTWQATPRLNLYGNWNQGTRVASVIELGCAYDSTVVPFTQTPTGGIVELTPEVLQQYPGTKPSGYRERSLVEKRGCNLPSALSGDPYLPQVVAQTYEAGARGKFKELLEWNISAYQTNVKDDIYLVAINPALSFFKDIGQTRRQGIEFGLSGEYGKSNFSVNYSLTDATFQSKFRMVSSNNSNVLTTNPSSALYNQIEVKPGDKMPGVPLHNINATWGYKLTPDWKISFNMVGHGGAFLRGNENNEHTPGPGRDLYVSVLDPITGSANTAIVKGPAARYSGRSPGYAVLNFRTTYDLGKGWTAGAMVNNLLDKEYFSAGRLGLTPFAPSVNGAIGPGGFNYNSSEWLSTQFMSAGAPRGAWFTLAYDFDASVKSLPESASQFVTEPDRTMLPSTPVPTRQELAVEQALNSTKALPILKAKSESERLAMLAFLQPTNTVAEGDVKMAIESWRKAWESKSTDAYLRSYADDFRPQGVANAHWKQQQLDKVLVKDNVSVSISNLQVSAQGLGMLAVFTEKYQASTREETVKKMLYLEQSNGQWRIVREQSFKPSNKLGKNLVEKNKSSAISEPPVSDGRTIQAPKTSHLALDRSLAFNASAKKDNQ
jgi:outer membrane receptor protein involved in Fe transport/ketosteroid isomerase-like protein